MTLFRFSNAFDPADRLRGLQRELDRVFENPHGFDLGVSGRGVFPAVNAFWEKDGCVVRLEVPGIAPESLIVESRGRSLTISGKREIAGPDGGSFHRRERTAGEFSRSVQLPEDLDLSRAEATYKHGVLTIRVPKNEEAKPRQIAVQAA